MLHLETSIKCLFNETVDRLLEHRTCLEVQLQVNRTLAASPKCFYVFLWMLDFIDC